MSSTPRTKEDIIKQVLRKLGSPPLRVELTKDQLADSYDDAARWFISRKGMRRTLMVPVPAGQQDFTGFPIDVDEIVEVIPPRSSFWDQIVWDEGAAFLGLDGFPVREGSPLRLDRYDYDLSGIVQCVQYNEQGQRILSGDFTWDWFPDQNMLRIYPKPVESGSMMVVYVSNDIDLKQLPVRMVDIVMRMTLAEAKERLGRIRSKFPEWPMASGERALDGDTLLAESATEKDALNLEIDGLSYPIPFMVG